MNDVDEMLNDLDMQAPVRPENEQAAAAISAAHGATEAVPNGAHPSLRRPPPNHSSSTPASASSR